MRNVIVPLAAVSGLLLTVAASLGVSDGRANAEEPYFSLTVLPKSASGPVARAHTVIAIPVLRTMMVEETFIVMQGPGLLLTFEVVAGPNAGASSDDGGCVPFDCVIENPELVKQVSWTYGGGNRPGTDTIRVCAVDLRAQTFDSLEQTNDVDNRLEVCETVFKQWVDGGYPLGGNIADQARENRERAAAAAQPAPTVAAPRTATGVTPPNTGDAGLADSAPPLALLVAGNLATSAIAGLLALRLARREG